MKRHCIRNDLTFLSVLSTMSILLLFGYFQNVFPSQNCPPTPYDEMGPFYRPNAPVRTIVGKGYLLKGTVRAAQGCRPLPGAMIEFWLVNEQGEYDEAHRATVIADMNGEYSFECNRPTDYVGRLPHIHIRVTAEGHQELITQHYPEKGKSGAKFDLVLSEN